MIDTNHIILFFAFLTLALSVALVGVAWIALHLSLSNAQHVHTNAQLTNLNITLTQQLNHLRFEGYALPKPAPLPADPIDLWLGRPSSDDTASPPRGIAPAKLAAEAETVVAQVEGGAA